MCYRVQYPCFPSMALLSTRLYVSTLTGVLIIGHRLCPKHGGRNQPSLDVKIYQDGWLDDQISTTSKIDKMFLLIMKITEG